MFFWVIKRPNGTTALARVRPSLPPRLRLLLRFDDLRLGLLLRVLPLAIIYYRKINFLEMAKFIY